MYPPANTGDIRDKGSIPGLGRSPGEGNGNPLQHSCLEKPMDRGATVHWVTKSQIRLMDRGATVHWVTKSQIRLSTATTKHPQPHCAHMELGKERPQKNTEEAESRNTHPSQLLPKRFPESPN